MKKTITMIFVCLCFLMVSRVNAQQRYLDEMFTDVVRVDSITYGSNISVFPPAGLKTLIMDVYYPATDTDSNRALILLACTGNFLPRPINGGANGTIKDSTVVELATRLAKRGYVVASFFYRQGWDFTNPSQDVQTATLLQAAYRGIQDARTVARFFRKDVAENGNTYGINPDKIAIGGVGTGGYISMGAAYLDDYEKIKLPKFTNFATGIPFVDTTVHGNIWGTNTTTLNIPNHVGYSSEVQFAFNLGGALGDSSWVDPGDIPVVSFHTPQDPNAPYDIGVVIVPTTGNVVIDEAAGSYAVARQANMFGNHQIFINAGLTDVYTVAANTNNYDSTLSMNLEGLMPFDRPFTPGTHDCGFAGITVPKVPEGSPWDWWNQAAFIADWDAATGGNPFPGAVMNCNSLASNPDMSPTKGRTYIDSVMGYLAPRMVIAMSLYATSIENELFDRALTVFPNPAQDKLTISNENTSNLINEVRMMDVAGRTVQHLTGLRTSEVSISRGNIPSGVYILQIRANIGMTTRKVVFE
ncbi:MAG: T9SS type A sorting domain-containing protein [Bacteroidia bacterium]|nr:T9SS type A sorting domain-containing protein [Bacteroidia bacterium]